MNRKLILFVGACQIFAQGALACTTFFFNRGNARIYGRTLDWSTDSGAVMINKRRVQKEAVLTDETVAAKTWTSRFASFTFNQIALGVPYGGINEKGLVVETLILNSTELPAIPEGEAALNESQWIQYMLDQAEDLDDVEELARQNHVLKAFAKVHYFVCDAQSRCGVFEFTDGQLQVYRGADLRVNTLTNSTYPESLTELAKYPGFGGEAPLPGGYKSLARFSRTASFVENYRGTNYVADAFKQISDVSNFIETRWQVVYEMHALRANIKTSSNRKERSIEFDPSFYESCHLPVRVFDLQREGSGNLNARLYPLTAEYNNELINSAKFLPENLKGLLRNYREICVE